MVAPQGVVAGWIGPLRRRPDAVADRPAVLLAVFLGIVGTAVVAELLPGPVGLAFALPILALVWKLSEPRPALLLIFWASLLFLESLAATNAEIKLSIPLMVLAVLRSGQAFPLDPTGARVIHRESGAVLWTICALVLFTAWMMFSATWSVEPDRIIEVAKIWIPLLAVFGVILYHPPDSRDLQHLSVALMGSACISILAGVFLGGMIPSVQAEEGRLIGGSGDPNFLAAGIPLVLALALVWLSHRSGRSIRLLLAAVLAVALVGLVLTASRGGILATAAITPIIVLYAGRHRSRVLALMVVGAILSAVAIFALPIGDRILNAGGGTGREELWSIALVLFADNPIQGVGIDNFPVLAGDLVREVGQLSDVDLIVNRPHQVHNTYLQVLTELGLVGIVLFVAFIGGSVVCCLRAGRLFAESGRPLAADLTRAFLAGLAGMMVAAIFLPFLFDRRFWLLLALGPALERMAVRTGTPSIARFGWRRWETNG